VKALLLVSISLLGLVASCAGSSGPASQAPTAPDAVSSDSAVPDRTSSASRTAADPKIVVESSMDLEVPVVRDAYAGVQRLVRGLGGYVAQGQLADDVRDSAKLRLRVPAARHDALLASLRSLSGAKVHREQSNATEVTAQFTDLEARLRNLQRSESQYQALLDKAGSIPDIVQVSAKLDDIRGQIETTQGRLNVLNDTTELATVTVTLLPPDVSTASEIPAPSKVFAFAVHASDAVGLVALNALVVAAVFAGWLVPVLLACILLWRLLGHRVRSIAHRVLSW
jgi:hypothetical protein